MKGEKDYLTDAFAGESVAFIESAKAQAWFHFLSFNTVHSPLEATEAYEARFPHITDKKRRTYAGMWSALDDAVGRVMTKVRKLGQEENALVMSYSDNGGPTAETSGRNDPLRGFKGQMYEGGIRVPFVMQWKGTLPAEQTYTQPVMGFDCHATALAAAKVAPKVAAASAAPDSAKAEATLATVDGVNLLPYLLGEKTDAPHDYLCWRARAQRAIRMGYWKLIQTPRENTARLFNLKADLSEQTDLAAKEPAKFNELAAKFAEWEKGTIPAKWVRQDVRNAEEGGKLKTDAPPAEALPELTKPSSPPTRTRTADSPARSIRSRSFSTPWTRTKTATPP